VTFLSHYLHIISRLFLQAAAKACSFWSMTSGLITREAEENLHSSGMGLGSRVAPVTRNKIETVTLHLEDRITAGEWNPNESLPPQGHLSREYGVSPGTIALAIRNLQQKRLVSIVSNKGAFVLDSAERESTARRYPLIGLRGSYLSSGGGSLSTTHALVGGIVEVANAEHCPLLLLPRSPEGQDFDPPYYRARAVEGAIFLGGESYQEALALRAAGFPVILANKPAGATPLSYVDYDHQQSLCHITERFLELGHRRIAVIFPKTTVEGYYDSLLPDFLSVLARQSALYDVRPYWKCVDLSAEGATAEAVKDLLALREPPTAIFALSPKAARQVIESAKARGLCLPEDLSIAASCFCGTDDAFVSGFVLPHRELGQRLLHEMHAFIENPFHSVQQLLPLTWVERGSVSSPARP